MTDTSINPKSWGAVVFHFALLIFFCAMLISCSDRERDVHVWERWQKELLSTASYKNPYRDIKLEVKYIGPENESFTAPGFWNGGSAFVIRTAFPSPGTWHWRTICSDTLNRGLHDQSGEVNVLPYEGENALYKNGFLKVSENKRYLAYDNDTPFLWVGTTAWVAPLRATLEDWKTFVDDCVNKKFSVIQLSPASRWSGDSLDVQGNPPFYGDDLDRWNPAYWNGFDEMVQYANKKGVIVFIVGLMEPVVRYPSEESASIFARNLTARLSGNFVILSPSFDSPFMELGNKVGTVINEATSRHLITQHPGTPYHPPIQTIADRYYNEDYLDFSMCQSGHNGGKRKLCVWKAVHWNLDLYRRGLKPVINGEAYYEADTTDHSRARKYLGTARDARELAYLSFLSGALGYTYGAYGIWNWESDSTKSWYWKKAMQYPGSTQMKYLHEFFADLPWWKLEPRHDLVLNQKNDSVSYMALSKTPDNDLLVAYLPQSDTIRINLDDFSFPAEVIWFDPVKGRYIAQGRRAGRDGNEFISPGLHESILLLKKTGS